MADFNPDKYLREKEKPTAAGFDPDAYLAAKQQTAPASAAEPPSGPESFKRGAVQGGTMGFGDELGGALQGGLQALANVGARLNASGHPGVADALEKIGIEAHYGTEPASEIYAQARDAMRREDASAARAHPGAFGAGALAGGIATAKPLGIAAGAIPGLAAKGLLPALGRGAALGALAGLGTSEADTPKGMALDAAGVTGAQRAAHDLSAGEYGAGALDLLGSGALGGTMATLGGYGLGRAISPAMDRLAIKAGSRALTNGARQLSTKEGLSDQAVRATLESGAMKAGSTTEGIHGRLEHLLGHDVPYPEPLTPGTPMALYGELIDALDAAGTPGAKVQSLADTLQSQSASEMATTGASKTIPDLYAAEAQNVRDIAPALERQPGVSSVKTKAPNLGLRQGEALKRSLQSDAKYGRYNDTRVNIAKKRIAAAVRQANEDAITAHAASNPEDAQLSALAAQFVPAKKMIGSLAEAEQAAREGAARGSHRSLFSLPEQIEATAHPDKLARLIAQSLVRPRLASTISAGSFGLSKPEVVAELAALLQRANQTGSRREDFAASAPIHRDEQGRPILVIHTGP